MEKNPRETILKTLNYHPEGLTITSIAIRTKMHRHTVTKYVYELIGSGIIQQRIVGMAKLCYLRRDMPRIEKTIRIGQKAEIGQTQLLVIFLFLLAIPALIIAQNITNSTFNLTGQVTQTLDLSTEITTIQEISPESTTTLLETIESTTITSETTTTTIPINDTEQLENSTVEVPINETITMSTTTTFTTIEPFINETESIINGTTTTTLETTTTIIETVSTTTTIIIELPEQLPQLDVKIEIPEKVTRGNSINLKAIVTNTFPNSKTISLKWVLPNGFSIISGNEIEECGIVETGSSCVSEISMSVSEIAELGKNQIKVVVNYE
jgi:DNA-binding Lrp family transcriptional regulator